MTRRPLNVDELVMLRKLNAAMAARKWRLAYAWADALDALMAAHDGPTPPATSGLLAGPPP